MKTIKAEAISNVVSDLCIKANTVLRGDVLAALKRALKKEKNKRAGDILEKIICNSQVAKRENLAICQDTGLPCVFVELGQDVRIVGDLKQAINKGVEAGYREGYFRNSVVLDPLSRGKSGFSPAVIHIEMVKGNKLALTVMPKGFGCENKTQLKMFRPTAQIAEIKKFIVEVVKTAGPDACPPYIVGVGIGGSADYAAFLAKQALLKPIDRRSSKLEKELLIRINKLNIGPMGLGGVSTALAVNIQTYPTHIAGLPVVVNISCHALRSATKSL